MTKNRVSQILIIMISLALSCSSGISVNEIEIKKIQINEIQKRITPECNILDHQTEQLFYKPYELIIKFKPNTQIDITTNKDIAKIDITSIDTLNEKYNVHKVNKVFKNIKSNNDDYGLSNIYKFNYQENSDISDIIEQYSNNPNVEYVMPNYIMQSCLAPNDPYFYTSGSWGQDYDDLYGLHLINAENAWDISTGSHEIVVGVIDSGVDYNHEDLASNMWINEDEIPDNDIDDDNDGFIDNIYGANFVEDDGDPMDYYGHGTHCSGTIAAIGNNDLGVVGVNWHCKIMSIKALNNRGNGYTDDLANALIWAADNGAKVLSNSWSSIMRRLSNPVLEDAVHYAYSKGCTIVFSAGNSNDDVYYYSPQNMDETIVVAATDHNNEKASFSNWGDLVDVSAPGVNILSLRADNTDIYAAKGYTPEEHFVPPFNSSAQYYRASGTSMSCPHVAGLIALMLSKNNSLTQDMIKSLLFNSVDEIDSNIYIGVGRINASETLQREPALALLNCTAQDTNLSGVVNITGTAWGNLFEYYIVEYGSGKNPESWIELINSTESVQNDVLATLNVTSMAEGVYTIKLQVRCSDGSYNDFKNIVVNNYINSFFVDDDNIDGPWDGTAENPYKYITDGMYSAGDGDDVFVCNGIYSEHLIIDRPMTLLGENANTTIISGFETYTEVIFFGADNIYISGFTITNAESGILTYYTSNHTIQGNIIKNNDYGITLQASFNNTITENTIIDNKNAGVFTDWYGFFIKCSNNTISNNYIFNNSGGVVLWFASYNNICDNYIDDNRSGSCEGIIVWDNCQYNVISNNTMHECIFLWEHVTENIVKGNTLTNCGSYAILIDDEANNNIIYENIIEGNTVGVELYNSINNTFYHNSFINNTEHVYLQPEDVNVWDNGYPAGGNYWDTYSGVDMYSGPEQNIAGSDGFGDISYNISDGTNQDRYPFIEQDGWKSPPDQPSNPNPADQAINIKLNPTISIFVTDPYEDPLTVFFYDGDGNQIGIAYDVPSGTRASMIWSGLASDTTYSWYVTVNDGIFSIQSDIWEFTTKKTFHNPSRFDFAPPTLSEYNG